MEPTTPTWRPARILGLAALALLLAGVVAMVVFVFRATGTRGLPGGDPATPRSAPARPPLAGASADAILNSAQAYVNQGERAKAEAVLKGAIAQHPEEQVFYVQLAQLLLAERRFGEAYANYEKALAIGPRDAATELAAGTAAGLADKPDRAVEHYMAAQTADPSDYRAPLYLAATQVKLNQTEEAKKNYLLSARLNPDNATPWGALAELALRENRLDIALQHVARARELQPTVAVWRLLESRALKRQGKPEQALALLINLDTAQKRLPGMMQQIAECYGMLARPLPAAEMYAAASDDDPANGPWAFEAALWFERAGEKQRGVPYARRAAALNVEGAPAVLERLSR